MELIEINEPPQMYFKLPISLKYIAACQGKLPGCASSPFTIKGFALGITVPH
jgi:hypothetical protein